MPENYQSEAKVIFYVRLDLKTFLKCSVVLQYFGILWYLMKTIKLVQLFEKIDLRTVFFSFFDFMEYCNLFCRILMNLVMFDKNI